MSPDLKTYEQNRNCTILYNALFKKIQFPIKPFPYKNNAIKKILLNIFVVFANIFEIKTTNIDSEILEVFKLVFSLI